MNISELTKVYISERDNTENYNQQLEFCIRHLTNFVGRDLSPAALSYETVNRWITNLQETCELSPSSVTRYRRAVLTIWKFAADLDLCEYPIVRRIKRVKLVHQPPEAFTIEQVASLIQSAKQERGIYGAGIRRALWWASIIGTAYDTGLRRGDILALPFDVSEGKPFQIVEKKTGRMQLRQISPRVCEWIRITGERDLAFPWLLGIREFPDHFNRIRDRAEIKRGHFKWLRRTNGSLLGTLGHSSQHVFETFYNDKTLSNTVQLPPAIPCPEPNTTTTQSKRLKKSDDT